MKIYLVGGAVRDHLLGLPVKERDWVVVGATIADMLQLGYRQVGKEFPVFLHPKTHEEYALARMERKVSPGYKGFTFDTSPLVTLEEDLLRRDLTINAMAESPEGEIIDPYHGKQDLKNRKLRHVSPSFAEDPVRILRIGRFLARYYYLSFQVAPETLELMTGMVAAGEVDALVPERVWKELERALGEKNPEQFFIVLETCGALQKLFNNLDVNDTGMKALVATAKLNNDPIVRFAALLHHLPKKSITQLCNHYRIPNDYRDMATLTAWHYVTALHAKNLPPHELINLFSALDIYRRPERFSLFLAACEGIANATNQHIDPAWLMQCATIVKSYNVQELVAAGLTGNELANQIQEKRTELLANWLSTT